MRSQMLIIHMFPGVTMEISSQLLDVGMRCSSTYGLSRHKYERLMVDILSNEPDDLGKWLHRLSHILK